MEDPAGSGETRREGPPEHGTAATRREDVAVAGAESLLTLPPELAARFEIVAELDAAGAEADMLRVRDAAGEELVLKLYRRGITPNREMWDTLRGVRSPHIVRLRDTGRAGGRAFEVMEYLPHGTLRAFIGKGDVTAELIIEVVRQVAAGLTVLHEQRVIHRDLKPENILLRLREPFQLALADFGLSRYVKQTAMFSSAGHTLAYSAPETFAGFVSVMRDWWSLGMIVRELALGEPPFADMVPEAVMLHLASRPIDVSGMADERLRLLCRGLLVRDPDDRWGGPEVAEWLDGGSPAVRESADSPLTAATAAAAATAAEVKPFLFGERIFDDRAELAAAMAGSWDETAERYFVRGGAARDTLTTWLRQFDDPRIHDVQGRDDLLDQVDGPLPADVRLLMLLRWLNPLLPPVYAGSTITLDDLGALAATALDPAAPEHHRARRVLDELTEHRVLATLARCPGGAELGELDGRLGDVARRWREAAAQARERHPQLARGLRPTTDVRAELLLIALDADRAGARLAEQVPAGTAALPVPVPWFDRLVGEARGDAAGLLVARLALPVAAAEAARIHAEIAARERLEVERQIRWREREVRRHAGRPAAVAVALAGCGLMAVVWAAFLLLSALSGEGETATAAAVAVLIAQVATETALAVALGAMYHPSYSLLQRVGVLGGRAGEAVGDAGGCGGCLIVALAVVVFSVLTKLLPPLVPLAGAAVYGGWTLLRWTRWKRWHEAERRKALEGG